jgi:hypothetical protein
MAQIESNIVTSSESFLANRENMLQLIAKVDHCKARASTKSALAKPRFAD